MCAASGSAPAARRWCRRRWRRTSSTRASPRPACWPRCWWPSSWITCRCTGRNTSSSAPAWPSRARRWRSGSASAACSCSRWSTRWRPSCSSHDVLHADETPVAMLKPGNGKTHRAYLWSYCTTQLQPDQGGRLRLRRQPRRPARARASSGCPAASTTPAGRASSSATTSAATRPASSSGVTEAGCMAHARRKFHDLWANHGSQLGEQALKFFVKLYEVEREVRELAADERQADPAGARPSRSPTPCTSGCTQQRQKVPDGSATAKAIDYSLNRWKALDALHRRRRSADRQQLGREPDPADRHRAQQLAVRRQPARRQARRGDHEPGALGAAQRARSLRVPARRARAAADAGTRSPRRRAPPGRQTRANSRCSGPRRRRCIGRSTCVRSLPPTAASLTTRA